MHGSPGTGVIDLPLVWAPFGQKPCQSVISVLAKLCPGTFLGRYAPAISVFHYVYVLVLFQVNLQGEKILHKFDRG